MTQPQSLQQQASRSHSAPGNTRRRLFPEYWKFRTTIGLTWHLREGDLATINAALRNDREAALQYMPSNDYDLIVEQVSALARNTTFRNWREAPGSKFLIVRNEQTLTTSKVTSFLSGVCYALSLEQQMEVRSIAFYCGKHLHRAGHEKAYQFLMRDLTMQFVENLNQDFLDRSGVNLADLWNQLQLHEKDTSRIRDVFRKVLSCIRRGTLWVLIDGIYLYQDKTLQAYKEYREGEVRDAMRLLNELVQEANETQEGVQLKVLVTNPTHEQQRSWGFQAETISFE
ncbi:hypothetical protein TgHK011_009453 [Trichoderma gracile]|nr:hypothetical protein TgHK011_009453 [Trichoderma gracile]